MHYHRVVRDGLLGSALRYCDMDIEREMLQCVCQIKKHVADLSGTPGWNRSAHAQSKSRGPVAQRSHSHRHRTAVKNTSHMDRVQRREPRGEGGPTSAAVGQSYGLSFLHWRRICSPPPLTKVRPCPCATRHRGGQRRGRGWVPEATGQWCRSGCQRPRRRASWMRYALKRRSAARTPCVVRTGGGANGDFKVVTLSHWLVSPVRCESICQWPKSPDRRGRARHVTIARSSHGAAAPAASRGS
jgi:hypothetical protein